MTLNDINNVPKEAQILIDTNIIIYAALAHDVFGDPSRRLLKRIEMGEIYGFIPTIVVNEVLHRFMIAELIENGSGKNPRDVINKVKVEPGILHTLSKTWTDIAYLYQINCSIVSEKEQTFTRSLSIGKEYNLLAKDAYIAAFAYTYNLSHIASNDADFMRVPWLTLWRPHPAVL
ncbi:MAG: PIN domain-containing protein [Methanomicrobiales archaeon]